jgi:hypothetical protein
MDAAPGAGVQEAVAANADTAENESPPAGLAGAVGPGVAEFEPGAAVVVGALTDDEVVGAGELGVVVGVAGVELVVAVAVVAVERWELDER